MVYNESLYYLQYSCINPIFGKNLFPKIFGQSDYRNFKSVISIEQNDEKAWFFACWYKFMEIRSWLKNIGVVVVKNGCGHSVVRNLKLAVCQGEMNRINWFLVCWYKFMKAKCYFNNFLVVVVKNGYWNSKICYITRTIWWNGLILCRLIQI